MTDDDDPPDNVIRFGNAMQIAIAEELAVFYESLVREKLPEELLALMEQFVERTKGSEPESQEAAAPIAGPADAE